MFSSPVNRHLSQGSIAFYDRLEKESSPIGLKKIGYLWLATAARMETRRKLLNAMARAGVEFQILKAADLSARLPDLRLIDLSRGILGLNCGILEPAKLISFYEQEVINLGGRLQYRSEVTGFLRDREGQINGIQAGDQEIPARTVIVATGAWTGLILARAGLKIPLVPRKRQLFSVPARDGALGRLLNTAGFNPYNLLPFTILPGGAYLRPGVASFILGYANPDQPPGLEAPARAEPDFYRTRIRPQVEPYFPAFQGLAPAYAWAGHYDEHPPDQTPFVARLAGGVLVVAGTSGSGVMKADSLGRIVAGLWEGQEKVKLGHGADFRVADLGFERRAAPPEEFML